MKQPSFVTVEKDGTVEVFVFQESHAEASAFFEEKIQDASIEVLNLYLIPLPSRTVNPKSLAEFTAAEAEAQAKADEEAKNKERNEAEAKIAKAKADIAAAKETLKALNAAE